MNKSIKSFIEKFIRQYAKKDNQFGYELSTNCDISLTTQEELIAGLIKFDRDTVRDMMLDHAQNLIDERLPIVESHDRYDQGLIGKVDQINGELTFHRIGGF